MSVNITYFVHGTTKDNENSEATGWLHGELSEKGIYQCEKLRDSIDIHEFDLVISSDLKRAVDSANIIFAKAENIQKDERLRECNYGILNGFPAKEVEYEGHVKLPFPQGESLKDVEKRIWDFCKYLKENCEGKRVALVSHKAPQMAFEVIVLGKTWEEAIEKDWRKTGAWQSGWKYRI